LRTSSTKQLQVRYEMWARRLLRRLPVKGPAPRIESAPGLRDRHGPVHAGAFLRERRIAFDCTHAEFPRIFVHELFHFVWLRAGNPVRHSYEELLLREQAARARGELGWSAEWRKRALTAHDIERRTRRWREYCCESFCDTAAWRYSGTAEHEEFTLSRRQRDFRQQWFVETIETKRMSL
jgi:hypothetical protein